MSSHQIKMLFSYLQHIHVVTLANLMFCIGIAYKLKMFWWQ